MTIGILSNEDFEREFGIRSEPKGNKDARSEVTIVEKESPGRKEGDNNVPESLRKIIGEDAVINGRQSAIGLASMFGVSPSSVSAYAKGATSTTNYNEPKVDLVTHLNKSRGRAIKRASKTLNSALGSITQDKLDYADAKDLSTIAKDMSVVIRNLEPQVVPTGESKTNQQFVIFAPTFKDEKSFEVIDVRE